MTCNEYTKKTNDYENLSYYYRIFQETCVSTKTIQLCLTVFIDNYDGKPGSGL